MGDVEAELQAGPLPRDRLLPLSRADDVGRYLLSRGRFALGAGFFFFQYRFQWLFSLVNLHLLPARPSGLDIPSEAHVSAAVADVLQPIQEQVDAVRGSETDHQLVIQIGNHAGGDHSHPQVKKSDIRRVRALEDVFDASVVGSAGFPNEDLKETSLIKLLMEQVLKSPNEHDMMAGLLPKNEDTEYQEISENFKNMGNEKVNIDAHDMFMITYACQCRTCQKKMQNQHS